MTVFGTTLDPAQIAGLVGLLATLALWLVVLGRERGQARFRQWEADRKARRDAAPGAPPARDQADREKKGPWG